MKKIFAILLAVSLLLAFAGCSVFDEEVELLVLLDEDLTDAEARGVASKIATFSDVIGVEYVTAEQAFADFADNFEDPSVLEGVDPGILRDRCIVTAKKSDSERLSRQISQLEGVSTVSIGDTSRLPDMITDFIH